MPKLPAILMLLVTPALGQATSDRVDRNVGDQGPLSVSQRVVDPGNARWARGTSLTDRFGQAQPQWLDQALDHRVDPRLNQRYLYQAPGVSAMLNQPDYAALTPDGTIVRNAQGIDGAVVQLTPANVVYILSPEYLAPPNQASADPADQALPPVNTDRVQPTPLVQHDQLMRDTRIDGRYDPNAPANLLDIAAIHRRAQQPRHPELEERSRRLREERAREAAER
ncbi:MAG: hypothetical protein AAGC44_15025 [Planctomycetota bacterium]